MSGPTRITRPLLDVLQVLVHAAGDETPLHGWAIMKATGRSGPTTYSVIDRLEDFGWLTGEWQTPNPTPGKPPRRLYRLTPTGYAAAYELLAERRPDALRGAPGPRPTLAPRLAEIVGDLHRRVHHRVRRRPHLRLPGATR